MLHARVSFIVGSMPVPAFCRASVLAMRWLLSAGILVSPMAGVRCVGATVPSDYLIDPCETEDNHTETICPIARLLPSFKRPIVIFGWAPTAGWRVLMACALSRSII